ncbi:Armadillo-type fold [Arabidopsis suecica]|uniref:Armadillo-type fold n=1 Tax=Arabidopsis suecica TaxID=45249 RepID=A0A8T2CCI3_ARASU|nr:Armadillo-type fold [Arabidopsis suecica]
MGPLVGANELSKAQALIDSADNLLKPQSSTDATLTLLEEIESLLATVEQDPTASVKRALFPPMKALVSADLLRNPDSDVRVSVVSCLTEIMRITAPEAPYNDDQMKEIFQVTIEAFEKLADASSRSYRKAEVVLETVSKVRSSLVMLDLECDDLVLEMFQRFLKIIRPDHPQLVLLSMETIMITVIDESEEVPMDLLEILLTTVKKESQDVSPAALTLVEKVLSSCACKLQPCIMEALNSSGTSMDMYSPVVSSICQSEFATTQAHNDVKPKENEADEKISEGQVVPNDSLEDKLNLGLSRKGNRSKRTARGGTRRANGDDKVITANEGLSESTDAETASVSTRKRGLKPNSLMNPEEGYSFKTSSSKKVQEKELGDSSLGKLAAKKVSLPTKVGQTNQSVVISLSSSGRARTGARKRSRTKMEETDHDVGSVATQPSKKQIVKKNNPAEEDLTKSNVEKSEDGIKTGKSSKKEKAHNGLAKTSAKKPLAETKMVKPSGKKSAHSDAKKKNSEGASMDTPIPRSSKTKKKDSRATTPSTKKSDQAPKSHLKRKRTAGEEVESNRSELGEELVGKTVNVWWPLDKKFYEGVVKSYSSLKKMHQVTYIDGDVEELNLKEERFEIIEDNSVSEDKEIDLPESTPLSAFIQREKAKKRKTVSKNVQPSSSPEVRSSVQTMKKKDSVTDSIKQAKRTKGALKAVSNEPESTAGKNLKSLKKLNGEPDNTKGRTGKKQKVTRAMHRKSETDCDEKEDPETKGEDSLKLGKESDAEPDCTGEHQELPENQTAETKTDGVEPNTEPETDGKERNSLKEPIAEPKSDGEEQEAAKEPNAEPKTNGNEPNAELEADGKECNSLKEPNAEPKAEGEEQEAAKEPNAEPKTDGEEQEAAKEPTAERKTEEEGHKVADEVEQKSLKETNVEPETEGEEEKSVEEPNAEEKESAKEQTADTKLIVNEEMSKKKGEEIDKETFTSIPETGKVKNEAEEDDQRVIEELKEESDKAEVSTSVLVVDP